MLVGYLVVGGVLLFLALVGVVWLCCGCLSGNMVAPAKYFCGGRTAEAAGIVGIAGVLMLIAL